MGFENFTVNEDPALQAKYEQFHANLEATLQKINPAELNKAKNETWDKASQDLGTETTDRYFDLKQALEFLQRLKAIQKKDEFLEKLAKTDLHVLNSAEQIASTLPEDIYDAVFQLHQTCNYLAQWKFKDEFNSQIDKLSESKKDDIEKRKEELGKMNVS